MDEPEPWPDDERAERLLDGGPADSRDAADARFTAVVRLLTAAVHDGVLDPARELAALTAFRAARASMREDTGARSARSAWSSRALAGGAAAAFALGGVAVAAGTGALPGPFRARTVHAGALPAGTLPASDRTTAPPAPGPTASFVPTADPLAAAVPPPPSDRTARALRAMCRTYEEAVRQGRDPDKKVVAQLRRAAGRKDRVPAYCLTLLAAPPVGGPSASGPATLRPSP
jgi:hypothetical protein